MWKKYIYMYVYICKKMWSSADRQQCLNQYMCIPSLSRGVLTVSPFVQHNHQSLTSVYILSSIPHHTTCKIYHQYCKHRIFMMYLTNIYYSAILDELFPTKQTYSSAHIRTCYIIIPHWLFPQQNWHFRDLFSENFSLRIWPELTLKSHPQLIHTWADLFSILF